MHVDKLLYGDTSKKVIISCLNSMFDEVVEYDKSLSCLYS